MGIIGREQHNKEENYPAAQGHIVRHVLCITECLLTKGACKAFIMTQSSDKVNDKHEKVITFEQITKTFTKLNR